MKESLADLENRLEFLELDTALLYKQKRDIDIQIAANDAEASKAEFVVSKLKEALPNE